MKKNISLFFLVFAVSFILGACYGEKNKYNEKVEVTGGRFLVNTDALEELKKEHPEISYEAGVGYEPLNIIPSAINEQLPTMYDVPFTEPQRIINVGYAGNITASIKKYGYDKKVDKKYLDIVTKDGEYYGLPIYVYNMGLMCNKKVFEEADLLDENGYPIYPETYEELARTASIIKQRTGKPGFFFPTTQKYGGWYFMNIAWSFGAEFEKEIDGKKIAAFNTPECVAALQYVKDLKWKYDALQDDIYDSFDDMFIKYNNDGVGMNLFGSSDLERYGANGWNKDNIVLYPNPAGTAGRYSLCGGTILMFNKSITQKQADACFLWIEKTYNPSVNERNIKRINERLERLSEQGKFIGFSEEQVWNVPEYSSKIKELNKKYQTVDERQYQEFERCEDVIIKIESYTHMQDLYNILDMVIQNVLNDENANPEELIAEAAETYQTKYLDVY